MSTTSYVRTHVWALWVTWELASVLVMHYMSDEVHQIYMFYAIWEFMQSRDCVAHSQNPEIAFESRDCAANLEIVQHAIYELWTLPDLSGEVHHIDTCSRSFVITVHVHVPKCYSFVMRITKNQHVYCFNFCVFHTSYQKANCDQKLHG